jgi:putative endonuclease
LNPLAPLYRLADRLRFRKHGNIGLRGEDIAHRYLRSWGFTVAARNWRPPQGGGELDIVAWDKDVLVFVEVKSRTNPESSAPERGIDEEKMRALRRSARAYVQRAGADVSRLRFDVLAISGEIVQHMRDTFSLSLPL